jgi:4-diphosphocytidyl-2-C-methyl-D-erythritol kinase
LPSRSRSGLLSARYCRQVISVRVLAPAKINLSLRVLGVRSDGFHEISTVFHAVSLADEVRVSAGPPGAGRVVTASGERAASVPTGDGNIAAQAALALARFAGLTDPDVTIDIAKSIPVAAGMAGGSADAAGALIALRSLWSVDISDEELRGIAAGIGSDVPFALVGGTAKGTGRGEVLTPVLASAELHWVVAISDGELSTPAVYAEWDRLVESGAIAPTPDPLDAPLLAALRRGDPREIAPCLVNDLQPAAIALRPSLASVLEAGRDLGALAGLVSGSGPTCVFLAPSRDAAIGLAAEMAGLGLVRAVRHAVGPVPGARIVAA